MLRRKPDSKDRLYQDIEESLKLFSEERRRKPSIVEKVLTRLGLPSPQASDLDFGTPLDALAIYDAYQEEMTRVEAEMIYDHIAA
jgi:hypothetical protein